MFWPFSIEGRIGLVLQQVLVFNLQLSYKLYNNNMNSWCGSELNVPYQSIHTVSTQQLNANHWALSETISRDQLPNLESATMSSSFVKQRHFLSQNLYVFPKKQTSDATVWQEIGHYSA